MCTLWSGSVVLLTSLYHQDRDDARVLFVAIVVLIVSAFVTLLCNLTLVYVVFYTGQWRFACT